MANRRERDRSTIESRTRQKPTAVTGVEAAIVTSLGGFITRHGPALGAAIGRAWDGEKACFVQIEASWHDGSHHCLMLAFTNVSPHGVYLESLSLIEPAGVRCELAEPASGMSFGGSHLKWGSPESLLPRQLPPGTDRALRIHVRMQPPDERSRRALVSLGAVTLEYRCSQLNKRQLVKGRIEIKLRETGPPPSYDVVGTR